MTDPNSATRRTDASPIPVTAVGAISISGKTRPMEDTIAVQQNLCSPHINRNGPIDFFAVYDGHGGPHVAGLCRDRMHIILYDELMTMDTTNLDMNVGSSSRGRGRGSGSGGSGSGCSSRRERVRKRLESEKLKEAWRIALKNCFHRIDEMAFVTCFECGIGTPCGCPPQSLGLSGSTAVLAIVTEKFIIVANCGDSRAVISRAGRALPLSFDHKPDRGDERARIEACGGRVEFGECARVQGILTTSRAIGDKYLKQYITSEPEFTFLRRKPEDECLILASDGLWNVVSIDKACYVARKYLYEENAVANHDSRRWINLDGGGSTILLTPSASASAMLAQLAVERNSQDNISVIVIDLKRNNTGV